MRHLHRPLGAVQPFALPQLIAAGVAVDSEAREAIIAMDVERMRARVSELEPAVMDLAQVGALPTMRRAITACYALLATLALAAGDTRAVHDYCIWAAADLADPEEQRDTDPCPPSAEALRAGGAL